MTIDGIEAHEAYITPISRAAYDRIIIGDALTVLPTLGQYDVALIVDVLEHFTMADGELLLELCREHARHVVVVVPHPARDQGVVYGNLYEVHRGFGWTQEALAELKPRWLHADPAGWIEAVITRAG